MAELNFKVDSNALQVIQNTKLDANFSEMETALKEFVAPYESLIVTEDAVSMAKSDRAKLRSIANNIDSYRKSVKSIYTTPLKEFEEKCKKLTGIIDNGVSNLDKQVKEYELKRREEKLFLLRDYFDNAQKSMKHPEYISWENVYIEKWGNVTYAVETAHKDIDNACLSVDRDVDQIVSLSSEFQTPLLDHYKQTHDVFGTFQMQERLAAQKLREEQRQRELEEQYKAKRAEKIAEEIKSQSNPKPQKEAESEPMFMATYRICGTQQEIMSLQNLLNTLKVKYMLVDTERIDNADAVLG